MKIQKSKLIVIILSNKRKHQDWPHTTDPEGGALDHIEPCPAQHSSITGGQTVGVTTQGPSMEF